LIYHLNLELRQTSLVQWHWRVRFQGNKRMHWHKRTWLYLPQKSFCKNTMPRGCPNFPRP